MEHFGTAIAFSSVSDTPMQTKPLLTYFSLSTMGDVISSLL
jgi:hypothetical protein